MNYVMYLRKSRDDLDAEAHGEGETLARHEARLTAYAQKAGLPIRRVYREIVSGETIAARPVMQKLLAEVQDGLWDGVLVVEVERLARGDTIDQGLVAQAFRLSGTKIITPLKTYDPCNEFDEEYFEFGLFMSRREYRTINRRLQAGRLASAQEGKWLGGTPPFGYDAYKLPHEKGSSLVPNADSAIVRTAFEIFTLEDDVGTVKLCSRLNALGYRSATGKPFHVRIIRELLRNPVYAGLTAYGRRAAEKTIADGKVIRKCPRHKEFAVYPGRHEAIIPPEMWQAAQAKLQRKSFVPVRKDKILKNPLAGLLICGKCGHKMQARNHSANLRLYCPMYCGMVSAGLAEIEALLCPALRQWFAGYTAEAAHSADLQRRAHLLAQSQTALQKELRLLSAKLSRAYDMAESGIYPPEIFAERHAHLTARRSEISQSLEQVNQQVLCLQNEMNHPPNLPPRAMPIMDIYELLDTPQQKNDLLKTLLSGIRYKKTSPVRGAADSDLDLTLFPLVPPAGKGIS